MRRARRASSGIDITPLIDVLFMLIIFFVLTTAFVQGAIVVDLPGGTPPPIDRDDPIVVTVTRTGELLWAGDAVTRVELAARAREAAASSEDVLVAGDREASFGAVAEILDELRRAGLSEAGLAFEGAAK